MMRNVLTSLVLVASLLTISSAAAEGGPGRAVDPLSPAETSSSGSASIEAPIDLFDGFFEQDPGDGSGGGCASSCSAECKATGSKCSVSCPLGTCAKCSSTCPVSCNCGG